METPYNKLTPAEVERLALLIEECSEIQQIACKILRHGYDSYHPNNPSVSNRQLLEEELGHYEVAVQLMVDNDDVNFIEMNSSSMRKSQTINKYLRHNKHGNY